MTALTEAAETPLAPTRAPATLVTHSSMAALVQVKFLEIFDGSLHMHAVCRYQ